MAGYFRGDVKRRLIELHVKELTFPEKDLVAKPAANQKDLQVSYDKAVAEIKCRRQHLAAIGKITKKWAEQFPRNAVHSRHIDKALEEHQQFMEVFLKFMKRRFEEESTSLSHRKSAAE